MNEAYGEPRCVEKDRGLAKHIRQRLSTLEANRLFADALGVGDDFDVLPAMALLPLAEVAWCDGEVSGLEKGAILRAAGELGIAPQSPMQAILQAWLVRRPSPAAIEGWRAYVRALVAAAGPESAAELEPEILGRAETIAAAAGGYLGVSKISAQERACLDKLARAFVPAG